MTYDEAKLDAFDALLPQIGSQFKWLHPGREEHLILWGMNRKTKVASLHVSYTNTVRQIHLRFFWYALAHQILVPLEWK